MMLFMGFSETMDQIAFVNEAPPRLFRRGLRNKPAPLSRGVEIIQMRGQRRQHVRFRQTKA